MALEIVAVRHVDRRVLLFQVAVEVGEVGLITYGWSWVGHSARRLSATSVCGCSGR